jgi:hypothetical protein
MKLFSHSWKQEGSLSLWRYTENERNYPGWHLTADLAGCQSLIALFEALAADGPSAFRTVDLTRPTRATLSVPNNRGGTADFESPEKLRIGFSENASHWSFPPQLEPAEFSYGYEWLSPLREGLNGIPLGKGDYSIGRDLPLWFWW